MPPFPRPKWDGDFPIDVGKDRKALRAHARQRGIPERTAGKLLLATWNVANLDVQKRDPQDHDLIADVIGWFDIVGPGGQRQPRRPALRHGTAARQLQGAVLEGLGQPGH